MSTAKAPAAPSGRICEKHKKCRKLYDISACKHLRIDEYDTMKSCSKFEVNLIRTS